MPDMKHLLSLVSLLLSVVALSAQTDLYHEYAAQRDLSVACVLGYKLADDHTVDVAMLHAKDSTAWLRLSQEFLLDTLSTSLRQALNNGNEVVLTRYAAIDNPQQPLAASASADNPCCYLGVSYLDHTIWVFYCRNNGQLDYLKTHLALDNQTPCEISPNATFYCFDASNQSAWNAFLH